MEDAGAVGGVGGEPEVQGAAPAWQGWDVAACEAQRGQEVVGDVGVEISSFGALSAGPVECTGDVLAVVEPDVVTDVDDAVIGVVQVVDLGAVNVPDVRNVFVDDADDGDVLVQDMVEVDVVPQGERCGLLVRVGKTARPGTRGICWVWTISTKSERGPSISRRRAWTDAAPSRQVSMIITTMPAISTGSQPPWKILATFARKNTSSRPRMSATATMIFQGATRHTNVAKIRKIAISNNRVPVTARP